MSFMWSLLSMFPDHYACYMPWPFLLPRSEDVNNIWWRLQIIELVMQVSPDSCYLFPLYVAQILFQHLVLKHPQFVSSFSWNNAVHSGENQKAYRRTYGLQLLGWRVSHARNRTKRVVNQASLTLQPWRWRRYIPPKRRSTFTGLHSVISKKTELCHIFQIFITYLSTFWRWDIPPGKWQDGNLN
jgi:hypothetical protein